MGVQVIFLNEAGLTFEVPEVGAALLMTGVILIVIAIAYLEVNTVQLSLKVLYSGHYSQEWKLSVVHICGFLVGVS